MAVLEASVTSGTREDMEKQPKTGKKLLKGTQAVAQELKLIRFLAGNSKTTRDRALKSLKRWFRNRPTTQPFVEDDFLRIWKGLFYSMWMSDKPLVQEECAENISSLVHSLSLEDFFLFYKCGMRLLMNEWFGLDHLRLNKFLMFVRRLLRQALFVLKKENWKKDLIQKFTQCLSETILEPQEPKSVGLLMHFIEIFLEEFAKVSEGKVWGHIFTGFLAPFIKHLAFSDDPRIIDHIKRHIFLYLIRQSKLGLEYEERYQAWKSAGFPGNINSMKKVAEPQEESDDDKEEEEEEQGGAEKTEKVYDPRAGRVSVDLPQIQFHPRRIVQAFAECKFDKNTNTKSRKCISVLTEHFEKMASGNYPLGIKKLTVAMNQYNTNLKKAVNRLVKFEQKVQGKKTKTKRKHETDSDIQLRGGKKIKLDNGLTQKIRQEFGRVALKRKNLETGDRPLKLQKRDEPQLEIESIFRRNSGTWFVTKAGQRRSEQKIKKQEKIEGSPAKQENQIEDSPAEQGNKIEYIPAWLENKIEGCAEVENNIEGSPAKQAKKIAGSPAKLEEKIAGSPAKLEKKVKGSPAQQDKIKGASPAKIGKSNEVSPAKRGSSIFPNSEWECSAENFETVVKAEASRLSLPLRLIKNPFASPSPIKKVKINTKLNRSQDVQQHVAQIFSSPDIPYDPEKKPVKPLLKTPVKMSPINPFYRK